MDWLPKTKWPLKETTMDFCDFFCFLFGLDACLWLQQASKHTSFAQSTKWIGDLISYLSLNPKTSLFFFFGAQTKLRTPFLQTQIDPFAANILISWLFGALIPNLHQFQQQKHTKRQEANKQKNLPPSSAQTLCSTASK
jgi:hypothetical protein